MRRMKVNGKKEIKEPTCVAKTKRPVESNSFKSRSNTNNYKSKRIINLEIKATHSENKNSTITDGTKTTQLVGPGAGAPLNECVFRERQPHRDE